MFLSNISPVTEGETEAWGDCVCLLLVPGLYIYVTCRAVNFVVNTKGTIIIIESGKEGRVGTAQW